MSTGQIAYRVWPDGTMQCVDDGEAPYSHMSDDYALVYAADEEDALRKISPPRQPTPKENT